MCGSCVDLMWCVGWFLSSQHDGFLVYFGSQASSLFVYYVWVTPIGFSFRWLWSFDYYGNGDNVWFNLIVLSLLMLVIPWSLGWSCTLFFPQLFDLYVNGFRYHLYLIYIPFAYKKKKTKLKCYYLSWLYQLICMNLVLFKLMGLLILLMIWRITIYLINLGWICWISWLLTSLALLWWLFVLQGPFGVTLLSALWTRGSYQIGVDGLLLCPNMFFFFSRWFGLGCCNRNTGFC